MILEITNVFPRISTEFSVNDALLLRILNALLPPRTIEMGAEKMEQTFSGYCRSIDAPRLVFCEAGGGEVEIDCDYARCPHAGDCPVGKQITQFLREAEAAR